jgi:4-amino-4-deoxy-L-arabinose transferase-like glycosyltransferase
MARLRRAAPVLALLALQAGLLAHTAWDKSDTADEPVYLAAALGQWVEGDLTSNCESPALPKWGFALALRLSDPTLFDLTVRQGRHPLWSRTLPQTRRNLFAARLTTLLVTLAGGVCVFLLASRFGRAAALAALALWVCSPNVLAQGSLATLDAWAAAGTAAAAWAGVRFFERPRLGRALLTGACVGLAAACKVTTLASLPVLAAGFAWACLRRTSGDIEPRTRLPRLLVGWTGLALGFLLTLWLVYGGRLARVQTELLCGEPVAGFGAHTFGPVPFAPWIEGLLVQVLHGRQGHRNYLFGEVRFDGWWWFYLAALAFKTTLGAQALVLLRLAAAWRRRPTRREWALDLALLALPLLLFVVMSAGRTQNGIKYLLPACPLALVWCARVWPLAAAAFGRAGVLAASLCLAAGAVESLRLHPHHLMFFNLWAGGPEGGPRYLIHGDDWGQDQRRLAAWQRAVRPWRLFYTYYAGEPLHWGVSYQPPPCTPTPGYYALQAIEVHRPRRIAPGCLDWLTVEAPDERLGHSIYIYLVTRARIARLVEARGRVQPFWASAPTDAGEQAGDAPPQRTADPSGTP